MKVLLRMLYLEWQLRTEEFSHALGVEIGSADLDPEGVLELDTLLSLYLGHVAVAPSSPIVRLVRFALQEHLLCDSTRFRNPHTTFPEGCLTRLNFGYIRDVFQSFAPPPNNSASIICLFIPG